VTPFRLGTRGSQLALWQARAVAEAIAGAGGPPSELVVIRTTGDRLADRSLAEAGGKRLFVKEIEEALISGAIDLAVHSAKDLPVDLAPGLTLGAVLPRADPRDCVVVRADVHVENDVGHLTLALGQSPRIGTSSARRVAQLARLWPAARFDAIRGNLDTRLRKLDSGDYDGLVLAAAGLVRLGLKSRMAVVLPFSACVPAPGQGTLAVEIRDGDRAVGSAVAPVNDPATFASLSAERALVRGLGGGCQLPIGAVAVERSGTLTLQAIVASLDGARVVRTAVEGSVLEAIALGERAAAQLIAEGAGDILGGMATLPSPQGSP
jgi:hydroxymethylbilane synthase